MRSRRLLFVVLANVFLASLATAAASDPKLAEKPYKDGLRFEQDGQWKEAEAAYSQAIELNPDSALYHLRRARVRLSVGDAAHALDDATAATHLDPNNGEAFQLLGNIDTQLKTPSRAVADYTRAIELGVTNAAIFNARARGPLRPGRERCRPGGLHHRNQAASR